ncbi:MAG: DUF4430 domain-containing protein [Patescibacteria group bacterium]
MNTRKKLKIYIGVVFVALLVIGSWGISRLQGLRAPELPQVEEENILREEEKETATLVIADGDEVLQEIEVSLEKEDTVLALMNRADLDFEYEEYNTGVLVTSISGLENNAEEGKYWIYYVDGEKGDSGASDYVVQPDQVIKWRFEEVDW